MRGISRYGKLSLMALGVFLLGILGYFILQQQGDASYIVMTDSSVSEQTKILPEEPEDGKPDSLLEGERININTASAADLCRLPGIGEKRAQAVIAYREEHPFQSLEELMEVNGIGPGIFEGLRDYISID